jgi:hypothetical protein
MVTVSSERTSGRNAVYVLHIAPGADQDAFCRGEEGIAEALALGELITCARG